MVFASMIDNKTIPQELEQYIKTFMYHQEYIVFGFGDIFFKVEESYDGLFKVFANKCLVARSCESYEDIKRVIEDEINRHE